METSLYISIAQQSALGGQMDIIAQNIANASTAAYKGERLMFKQYLAPDGNGGTISYVEEAGLSIDYSQGDLTPTGNLLDVAIEGDGFFVVQTPEGDMRYTRAGQFRLDGDLTLITGDGLPVLDVNDRPIQLDPTDVAVEIGRDGTIATEAGERGRIKIVSFENTGALSKLAGSLYESLEEPVAATDVQLFQGMVEESNVEPIIEITRMIDAVGAYQSAQSALETKHDLLRSAIQTLLDTNPSA